MERKNIVALAHPYHAIKSCSKVDDIPLSGLSGEIVTDGWTDDRKAGGVHNILIANVW